MKIMRFVAVTLFVILFVSLSFAVNDKPVIQPYAAMVKSVGLPVPTKENFQKMLQKFSDELYGNGFKEFSEKDFFHGHLIYRGEKGNERLTGILYHSQEFEVFDKNMRSWWQEYAADKVIGPMNALGMMRIDMPVEDSVRISQTGTVFPVNLHRSIAGVNRVDVSFHSIDTTAPTLDNNVIDLNMNGKKIYLVVMYRKF